MDQQDQKKAYLKAKQAETMESRAKVIEKAIELKTQGLKNKAVEEDRIY